MKRLRSRWIAAVFWLQLTLGAAVVGQAQTALTFATTGLSSVTAGKFVRIKLQATGGSQPYTWKVTGGSLPPGLKLNPTTGGISGTPTTAGSYRFQLLLADSGGPPMQVQREFTLVVTAAVGIDWKQAPVVQGQKLSGSLVVNNYTDRAFTVTVIVMAVNEIGRATALGYQEFQLKPGGQQVIPFGSEPGPGNYIVHADAVAEVAATNTIYRARQQTQGKLEIQSPE